MKVYEIYDTLSNTYASPYPDKQEDKAKALSFFANELKRDPSALAKLRPKLEELMRKQKNMKGKFSAIILDKYWNKEYTKTPTRSYNPNQK